MTLPFRRRHHDDESAHDRARALWSTAMLEPLDERDRTWLDTHLADCAECRLEHEAYLADRELLRALRDRQPEPPRDLWARTSAAIERESGRRSRGRAGRPRSSGRPLPDRILPWRSRLPIGVLSGVLVVLVVVGVSIAPRLIPLQAGPTAAGSAVAVGTPAAVPSPLNVRTAPVAWVQSGTDGSYQVRIANIDEVCSNSKAGCAPLDDSTRSLLTLGSAPQALVGSPDNDQLVVVSGPNGSRAGEVIVVPVATPAASPTSNPTVTAVPTVPASGAPATPAPSGGAAATPLPIPAGAHSIAEGVTVVGEARYSADGMWLAFSAAPIDGSTGPDLYVWNGTDRSAVRVTTDHATYFSGWLGDRILASRVPAATAAPQTPAAAPTDAAAPIILEAHPVSLIFDPATGTLVDLALPDVWLPSVDPTGKFVTYWSGVVLTGPGVRGIQLGAGHLVLAAWTDPSDAGASHPPRPSAVDAPIELAASPISAFDTRFDPTGTRLAVWVADPSDPSVGTLRLLVLDRGNGRVNDKLNPLPSVRALKGFSMDEGRLAWVSPPGQDGKQSTVQVLAWSNDNFGQVETVPGEQLTIVR